MTDPIGVDGLREANRALAKLGDELAPAVKRIQQDAADVVADDARRHAPHGRRGDPRRGHPGLLESSIRTGVTQRAATIKAGSRRVPYAAADHFGAVRDSTTGRRRNIPANPWMYEALDRRRGDVLDVLEVGLEVLTDQLIGDA